MKTVDLHTHSTVSDGTYTPAELAAYAHEKGLSAMALTDHESSEGVAEALSAASEGLEIIPGIEISADFLGKEVHIVGLYVDYTDTRYNNELNILKEKRKKRNIALIEKFNSLGVQLTYDELMSVSDSKIITRAHFAMLLLKKGIVSSMSEAFSRFLSEGRSAYIRRPLPSVEKAAEIIHNAGGITVLAHPYTYCFSSENLQKLIAHVSETGFTGIECYYPTHTPSETKHMLDMAQKYNLLPSGGSDFHGSNKPSLDLAVGYGKLSVPYSVLENLKGRVKNV